MRKCVPEQRTRDYNWKKYKIQAFKVEHKFNPNPSSWIFPKGLAYDFWSKFPNSLKFVSCQIGPGNDVWWCSTEVGRSSWPYFEMSILGSHHLGFFPKGLAYDFWSKFQISLKVVYCQIGPGNDVWWCSTEVRRLSWPYLEMSNFGTRQLWLFGSFLMPFEHKNMHLFKNSTLQFFYPNKKLIQSNRRQYINACLKKKIRNYS